ncbi:hypothetical protein [Cytobacillus purgationiresistens]|uniref:DUF5668 domain-containing protein n=1 Tax=Cytobacillus purgationiresistens TaxID=863449 RepID=A0ABU0AQJ9_9BACI|nr:hypothetical protein [Cytobacillus purgationiresistens]MDQ0273539.1 hypothetical protein [Cytobacillus purgationiresistens]
MRTWRVGTFSMGASLLLLGIYLLLSQIAGMEISHILMSWWPIILVVLGIEILLFLFFSKQEKPYLKYDILSILIVGFLGTIGIGFALLSSIGVVDRVAVAIDKEDRTYDLPAFEQALKEDIKRIVIDSGNNPLTIEGTNASEVSLFGTYRAATAKNEKLITAPEDYVNTNVKGDTLYVTLKGLPNEATGMFDYYGMMSAVVLIPQDVKLEVIGNHNAITLKPRELMSDWSIDKSSNTNIQLEANSNVKIVAANIDYIEGNQDGWQIKKKQKTEAVDDDGYYEEPNTGIEEAIFKNGDGKHQIHVTNSSEVSLKTVH